jgi:ankyrin repeat protein
MTLGLEMLTEKQLLSIFAAVAEKYGVYLTEKGSDAFKAFEAFQSTIQEINHPSPQFHEIEIADDGGVVAQFLEHLNKKKQQNQSPLTTEYFQGELNGFKVKLQNSLMNSSRAIFLSEAKKEASCLGIDEEASSNLITFAATPNAFSQFKKIVANLKKAFDEDHQLKTAIESALRACNPEVSLGDPKRQENLRSLINSTVQKNESLLYILQNLNIVSTQRFAEIKDLSLSSFKKEVLLDAYRTSLEGRSESPFDSEGHISKFTQYCIDHLVPATTYAAAVTLEKTISLKEQEELPEANIKKTNEKGSYELRRINTTSVDADNPQHWLCYHLGDAVNCCLHAGGDSEQCIIDGLTEPTSGFYIVTEKKSRGNPKEKICAAIYAFISQTGNLILDSIEPLHAHGNSEYAAIVRELVIDFAATVVHDTQIQRVCLGTGGNTKICFNKDSMFNKQLPTLHEQTQGDTYQYDSRQVIVLAHSASEEARLQALIDALVGTREESETEDTQELRTIVRDLILTYCSDSFYVDKTNDIDDYRDLLKSKGLASLFQKSKIPEEQGVLTLLLCMAIENNNKNIQDILLKKGAQLNLAEASKLGRIDIVKTLLQEQGTDINCTDRFGETALLNAVKHDCLDIVRVLLATTLAIDVNRGDFIQRTPLFHAVQMKQREIVEALLSAGADINIPNTHGETALFYAAQQREIVEALLSAGARVDFPNNRGETALFYAVQSGRIESIKALLQAGADINFHNKRGETALFYAVQSGRIESIKALLDYPGIDVNCANQDGKTPLSLATEKNNSNIIMLLNEKIASQESEKALSMEKNLLFSDPNNMPAKPGRRNTF